MGAHLLGEGGGEERRTWKLCRNVKFFSTEECRPGVTTTHRVCLALKIRREDKLEERVEECGGNVALEWSDNGCNTICNMDRIDLGNPGWASAKVLGGSRRCNQGRRQGS